jgi:hypothetical protein
MAMFWTKVVEKIKTHYFKIAFNHKKMLLDPSMFATCVSWAAYPQAFQ